uniref:Uncharacterized protein n=1 Tax=Alexandrium monilatum TaxID=311494 RepID=A0A7S4UZC7_9DINO
MSAPGVSPGGAEARLPPRAPCRQASGSLSPTDIRWMRYGPERCHDLQGQGGEACRNSQRQGNDDDVAIDLRGLNFNVLEAPSPCRARCRRSQLSLGPQAAHALELSESWLDSPRHARASPSHPAGLGPEPFGPLRLLPPVRASQGSALGDASCIGVASGDASGMATVAVLGAASAFRAMSPASRRSRRSRRSSLIGGEARRPEADVRLAHESFGAESSVSTTAGGELSQPSCPTPAAASQAAGFEQEEGEAQAAEDVLPDAADALQATGEEAEEPSQCFFIGSPPAEARHGLRCREPQEVPAVTFLEQALSEAQRRAREAEEGLQRERERSLGLMARAQDLIEMVAAGDKEMVEREGQMVEREAQVKAREEVQQDIFREQHGLLEKDRRAVEAERCALALREARLEDREVCVQDVETKLLQREVALQEAEAALLQREAALQEALAARDFQAAEEALKAPRTLEVGACFADVAAQTEEAKVVACFADMAAQTDEAKVAGRWRSLWPPGFLRLFVLIVVVVRLSLFQPQEPLGGSPPAFDLVDLCMRCPATRCPATPCPERLQPPAPACRPCPACPQPPSQLLGDNRTGMDTPRNMSWQGHDGRHRPRRSQASTAVGPGHAGTEAELPPRRRATQLGVLSGLFLYGLM